MTLLAGEKDFDLYYLTFLKIEMEARDIQASHGDQPYLLRLYSGRALSHVRSLYTHSGSHPEIDPPNRNPDEDVIPAVIALNAGREFLQKNYLDLWAAAYLMAENAAIEPDRSMKEVDPFTDLVEGEAETKAATAPSRGASEWMRDELEYFYTEDLFLQMRVEELSRRHGNNDSELIAGLSGREIIAYMREHLPEPDPRALNSGSDLPQKKPIVDPAGRFSNGGLDVNRDRAGVAGKGGIRTFLWACLGLLLIACVCGILFVRRTRN